MLVNALTNITWWDIIVKCYQNKYYTCKYVLFLFYIYIMNENIYYLNFDLWERTLYKKLFI